MRSRPPHRSPPRSAPPRRRPEVADLIRRRFHARRPDELWCTDITQMRTRQGWLYAAVILDVFSRRIVSWSTASLPVLELALDALQGAMGTRHPKPGTILHSDRGNQGGIKVSSQHRLVSESVDARRAPRRGSSNQGSCGVGG